MDGKVYTLTLLGVDLYDLICKQKEGPLVLLPKHAVKMVVLPDETPPVSSEKS